MRGAKLQVLTKKLQAQQTQNEKLKVTDSVETKLAKHADRILVAGDFDTVTGFRLAGITTAVDSDAADFEAKLLESIPGTGILIVTIEAFQKLSAKTKKKFADSAKPVVVTVPSKKLVDEGEESIARMIKKAIGIELK